MILPVSCSIDLDFDCEKVWQIISEPGNLNKTHPFCKSNKVVNWDKNKHDSNDNNQPDRGETNVDESDEARISRSDISIFPLIPTFGLTIDF